MQILLVEDRDEDAELTQLALSSALLNAEIHRVTDGEQAMKFLFQADENDISDLKLILLDINLPKVNGLELLKNLKRSNLKHIPVVMLTTSSQDSDVLSAYENYVNSFILKPVSFTDFQDAVSNLAHYWLNLNVTVNMLSERT